MNFDNDGDNADTDDDNDGTLDSNDSDATETSDFDLMVQEIMQIRMMIMQLDIDAYFTESLDTWR